MPAPDVASKEVIGGWQVGGELGTGHFAKVKLGTHLATGQQCAIKIIKKPEGACSCLCSPWRECLSLSPATGHSPRL